MKYSKYYSQTVLLLTYFTVEKVFLHSFFVLFSRMKNHGSISWNAKWKWILIHLFHFSTLIVANFGILYNVLVFVFVCVRVRPVNKPRQITVICNTEHEHLEKHFRLQIFASNENVFFFSLAFNSKWNSSSATGKFSYFICILYKWKSILAKKRSKKKLLFEMGKRPQK